MVLSRDASRITHAFVSGGWQARVTSPSRAAAHSCVDRHEGPPAARLDRTYTYTARGHVAAQIAVELVYQAPAKSRVFLADYRKPSAARCALKHGSAYYRRFRGRFVFHMTPGLPHWLTRALGRPAAGYGVTVTRRGHRQGLNILVFAYQDARNPDVLYDVQVEEDASSRPAALVFVRLNR